MNSAGGKKYRALTKHHPHGQNPAFHVINLKRSASSGLRVSPFPTSLTWNVCPVVLDVHLMQSRLSGGVLHCDRPVQVVRDQRLGRFPRGHQDLACKKGGGASSEKKFSRHWKNIVVWLCLLTCDFALSEGKRYHHVEGSEAAAVHAAPHWIQFVRRHLEEDRRT